MSPDDSDAGSVEVHNETVYYEVEGDSAQGLLGALTRHGPRIGGEQFFGLTEWEVSAQYRWAERPAGCAVDDLTVRVSVKTHLPRWRGAGGASSGTRAAWARFVAALDHHEAGHRSLAEEAGDAIRERLVSLRVPTCERIKREAQREVLAVLNEYDARNRAYDHDTGHGRTQDAVWPPLHPLAEVP